MLIYIIFKHEDILAKQELRAAFEAEAASTGRERLMLTAAVGVGIETVQKAYEIDLISK